MSARSRRRARPDPEPRPVTAQPKGPSGGSECLVVGSHVRPQRCQCDCTCCRGRCDVEEHALDADHSAVLCPDSAEFVYTKDGRIHA